MAYHIKVDFSVIDYMIDIWSILENVPCVLEKNVYLSSFEWNFCRCLLGPIWSIVMFKSTVYWFSFFYPYGKSGIGISTIIVFLLISPFKSIDICFAYLSALMLDTYLFIVSSKLTLEHYIMTFFVFRDSFDLVYFIWWGFLGGLDGKESACSAGEGNGNPLRYSCLEGPIDRGSW